MPATPRPPSQGDFNKISILESVAGADGGVNSYVEPYYLEENQLAYLKNGVLDVPGLRSKRTGCQTIGGPGTNAQGLGTWISDDRTRYLVGAWGTWVYWSTGDLLWPRAHGESTISLAPSFYNFAQGTAYWVTSTTDWTVQHSCLFANGILPWTGATYPSLIMICDNGQATQNVSLCPKAMTWWQGRLWIGNLSTDDFHANTLMWSDLWDGGTINTNNNIDIDLEGGDELMAIVPTRQTAPRVYLFKKHKIFALDVVWGTGVYVPSTENTLDTQNSRLSIVSEDKGCVAPKTIVYTSGSGEADVFFLAADGYRSLRRVEQDVAGGAGEAISEPVKDVIDRINWASVERAVATIYDHKIFLSIPVDGSSVNNATLVFDLIKKVWVGEHTLGPRDSIAWDFSDQDQRLYLQWPYETTETLSGVGATSVHHVFHALASDQYYDPSLTSIEYEEHSKSFVFGDFGVLKRWDLVEFMLEPATTDATLSAYAKVDEQNWMLMDYLSIQPVFEYPVLPAALPWDFEQKGPQIVRLGSLIDFPPGRRLQFRLTTDSPTTFGVRLLRTKAWHYPEKWE